MQNFVRVVRPEVNGKRFREPRDTRLQDLIAAVRATPGPAKYAAGKFQTWIGEYLRNLGHYVEREVPVNGGRIDLIVNGSPEMGIELDNRTVRYKSIEKLREFSYGVAVLRRAYPDDADQIPGIIVIYLY